MPEALYPAISLRKMIEAKCPSQSIDRIIYTVLKSRAWPRVPLGVTLWHAEEFYDPNAQHGKNEDYADFFSDGPEE